MRLNLFANLGVAAGLGLSLAAACEPTESTCRELVTCGGGSGGQAGGSAGDESGAGGSHAAAGESSGSGGAAAGHSGEGGSGAAGRPPCDGACAPPTPVCDEATDTCVECIANTHCGGSTPACDEPTHTCVECTSRDDCAGTTPHCDVAENACVECLMSSDCTAASASRCADGACATCAEHADCAHIAGKGVCDDGECVECTGTKFEACGDAQGVPLVCNSLERTCTTIRQRSSGLCKPCVSDAQCALGQVCVLQTYGEPAQDVGYFCHWKQGDTVNGAPSDCAATGRPYVRTIANALSIDDETADVCALQVSTCAALNDFRAADCRPGGQAGDAMCGFDGPNDAKCLPFGTTGFLCTMTCLGNIDCLPNSVCNTGVIPPVCDF